MDTLLKLPSGKGYVDLATAICLQRSERKHHADISVVCVDAAFMDLNYDVSEDADRAAFEQDWEALSKHMLEVNQEAQNPDMVSAAAADWEDN